MENFIKWFNDNQGFAGAILSGFAMLISITFGVISICRSRKAKKSEDKAAEYAKSANEHNKAAKNYYDKMCSVLDREDLKLSEAELKDKVFDFVCILGEMVSTSKVAKSIEISDQEAEDLLYILWKSDGKIKQHIPMGRGNFTRATWIKNRG